MSHQLTTIYLGLGCNMGDRERNLTAAIAEIENRIGLISAVSPVYVTAALSPPELADTGQPDFLNTCVKAETSLQAEEVLEQIFAIEAILGRDRSQSLRWGPRQIDIDILLFGDQVIDRVNLSIPHPQLAERDFVLVPLADIAPDVHHPSSGHTITDLLIDHTERGKECFVTGVYQTALSSNSTNSTS